MIILISGMLTGHKHKKRRKENDNVFWSFYVLYVLIFTLTEHTLNSKDSIESVQMQMQSASLLRWFLYYSSNHWLVTYIKWYNELFTLWIVKQVFPFQFWHALLVLCIPLSSAQWSYAEIRLKKQW